jgi:hypothetical protein
MANLHIGDGDGTVRRRTKRLAKRAKRASREVKHSAERAVDMTAAQARRAGRATLQSMKRHPIAWTSAALGAAAVAGLLALRRPGLGR